MSDVSFEAAPQSTTQPSGLFTPLVRVKRRRSQPPQIQCQKCADEGYDGIKYIAVWFQRHLALHATLADENASEADIRQARAALRDQRRYKAKRAKNGSSNAKDAKGSKNVNCVKKGDNLDTCEGDKEEDDDVEPKIHQVSEEEVEQFQRTIQSAAADVVPNQPASPEQQEKKSLPAPTGHTDPTVQHWLEQRRQLGLAETVELASLRQRIEQQYKKARDEIDAQVITHLLQKKK